MEAGVRQNICRVRKLCYIPIMFRILLALLLTLRALLGARPLLRSAR